MEFGKKIMVMDCMEHRRLMDCLRGKTTALENLKLWELQTPICSISEIVETISQLVMNPPLHFLSRVQLLGWKKDDYKTICEST